MAALFINDETPVLFHTHLMSLLVTRGAGLWPEMWTPLRLYAMYAVM